MRESSANGFRGHGPKTAYPRSPKAYHKQCTVFLVPVVGTRPKPSTRSPQSSSDRLAPVLIPCKIHHPPHSLAHLRLVRSHRHCSLLALFGFNSCAAGCPVPSRLCSIDQPLRAIYVSAVGLLFLGGVEDTSADSGYQKGFTRSVQK